MATPIRFTPADDGQRRRPALFSVTIVQADHRTHLVEAVATFTDPTLDPNQIAQHWVGLLRSNFGVTSARLDEYFADQPGWALAASTKDDDGKQWLAVIHPSNRGSDVITRLKAELSRVPIAE